LRRVILIELDHELLRLFLIANLQAHNGNIVGEYGWRKSQKGGGSEQDFVHV
jgi:hypothetical protein